MHSGKKFFISPYRSYKYEKGQCYYENSKEFSKDEYFDICYNAYKRVKHKTIGLHSYSTKTKALQSWGECVRCIIPEGAKYYYNSIKKEYVSNYLIIGTDKDIIK